MTLEGWIISKQMYAGLIPGVNIFNRPRVLSLFIEIGVNEASAMAYASIASHPDLDPTKVIDIIMDKAVPPLSPILEMERETDAAIAMLKAIAPKRDKNHG